LDVVNPFELVGVVEPSPVGSTGEELDPWGFVDELPRTGGVKVPCPHVVVVSPTGTELEVLDVVEEIVVVVVGLGLFPCHG